MFIDELTDSEYAKNKLIDKISSLEKQNQDPEFLGKLYCYLAQYHIKRKEFDEGKKCLEKALSLFPSQTKNHAECLCFLVKLNLIKGHVEEALEEINVATLYFIEHTHEIAEEMMGSLAHCQCAVYYHLKSKHENEKAINLLEKAVILLDSISSVKHEKIRYEFGVKFELGSAKETRNTEYAIKLASAKKTIYREYAIVLEDRSLYEPSEDYYKKAMALTDPNSGEYFQLVEDLAINYSHQKKYQEAVEHYSKAGEYYEKYEDAEGQVRINNLISYTHFKQGHRKESLDYALKAMESLDVIEEAGMKAAILDTVGCAYQLNEDYPNAEKTMRAAIEQADLDSYFDPKRKTSYYSQLGDILEAQGKMEEARAVRDRAAMPLTP